MSLSANQKKLLAEYQKLPLLSKQVITLFSLAYFEITQTKMISIVNNSPFKGFRHGMIRYDELKPIIKELNLQMLLIITNGKGYQCNPEIVEIITRESIKDDVFKICARSLEFEMEQSSYLTNNDLFVLARIALYRGDKNLDAEIKRIKEAKREYYRPIYDPTFIFTVLSVLLNPFDKEFMKEFKIQEEYLNLFYSGIVFQSVENSVSNPVAIEYVFELCKAKDNRITAAVAGLLLEHLILQGRFTDIKEIEDLYPEREEFSIQSMEALLSFIQNKTEETIVYLDEVVRLLKKIEKKKIYVLQSFKSFLYFFALLKNGGLDNYQKALVYSAKISMDSRHRFCSPFKSLYGFCLFISRAEKDVNRIALGYLPPSTVSFWDNFINGIVIFWMNPKSAVKCLPQLKKTLTLAKESEYKWMEMQLLDLISKIEKTESKEAEKLKQELGSFFLTDIIEKQEEWKLLLNALSVVKSNSSDSSKNQKDAKRLAWFISYSKKEKICTNMQPFEQSYSAKTGWSSGKPISLKRLKIESNKFPFLSEQDLRVVTQIKYQFNPYYGGSEYSLEKNSLIELIGNQNLYWSDSKTRFDLEKGEPELSVIEEKNNSIKLILNPSKIGEEDIFALSLETPSRLKIILFTPEHKRIAKILGNSSLTVPKEAREQVLNAITNLSSSIIIQSDIGGSESQTEKLNALSTPYLHLLPFDAGLRVSAFCRPFAGEGPYYKPGKGGKNLIAEIAGKKYNTTRNLLEEEERLAEVLQLCPFLNSAESESEQEWILEDPETCLEVLLELQSLEDKIIIEWPEGEKFKLKNQAGISRFHIGIKKDNDWFSMSGSLDLGNKEVLEMQTLLELLNQSPGRFIKMSDGGFLALTETFRKQLDELQAFSEKTKDGLRFSPLISPLLEDMILESASLKADKAWKTQVQKLKALKDFKPELPNTFQATLRDYQREGFEWLARLSHWGVGACLADDMGLGKTIQSLALLLTRASNGPSLVIAPSSVCMNWHSESMRFAPTLNTIQFGGKNREDVVRKLKAFDLLVCSYGMIQQEDVAEILKSVQWQVIILDEAQAIKNMSTKRSQAVMSLQAGFRLLTTGTPIENHLGELWNLFRFLNPGLLGSLDKFNERFAIPIEKNKDKAARNQLKKLIQPFLLRRMKNQVLSELPEKTDITLQVELSDKERAFYEALRLNAIKKLADKNLPPGQKHLQILAEIMKLRRACCNSKLVEAKIDLPSSKFEAFTEILSELLENKHKALIFSQFVDHLSIIKKYLEEKKISFQYLDGSTPMKDRKTRVDAFQKGEGEVFLISLKAGGTGLNLTAADYVIHMDPWWNPAVEDQASDRAHRIGQKRPVTVYRLVAKDTIEAKIVDLHKHKRDLADSLLEETDMSGKISADDLLSLLKGA
jgi:SNF2 family DNA or RNA helicase